MSETQAFEVIELLKLMTALQVVTAIIITLILAVNAPIRRKP